MSNSSGVARQAVQFKEQLSTTKINFQVSRSERKAVGVEVRPELRGKKD